MSEFKEFPKIQQIGKLYMSITKKAHGSNAQVYIYRDADAVLKIQTGSRSRWVTPEDDNYGFAKFVHANYLFRLRKGFRIRTTDYRHGR